MAKDTASLKISVDSRDVKNADKDLNKFEQSSKKTEKSTNGLNTSFGNLKTSAIRLATSFVGLYSISEIAKSFIKASDAATQMDSKLKLVTTSAKNLEEVQSRLFKVSQDSNSVYTDTVELYARLARSTSQIGTSQSDLLTITETINKAMLVSGATAEEASNSVFQLSQAFMGGTLRAEEYNSIIDQAPRLLQAMADSAKMSMGDFRKAMLEGKISSKFMINALKNQAEVINNEYSKMGKTTENSILLVKNSLVDLVDFIESDFKIGSSIANETQEMSKWLTQNKEEILDYAQDIKAVGTLVADGLENIYLASQMGYSEFYLMFQQEIDSILQDIIETVNETGKFWSDVFGKDFTPMHGLRLDVEATTKIINDNTAAILENEKSSNKAWLELATGVEAYKKQLEEVSTLSSKASSFSGGGSFFSKEELKELEDLSYEMYDEMEKNQEDFAKMMQDNYSSMLDSQIALTESTNAWNDGLDGVAGTMMSLSKAMNKFNADQLRATKAQFDLDRKYQKITEENELSKAQLIKLNAEYVKEKGNLEQQNTQNQIAGYAQLAGAMSQMFEQGSRESKMALLAQQALAVANGVATVLNVGTSGDGYTALARVAAAIGVVGSVLSMGGIAFSGGGGVGASANNATSDVASRQASSASSFRQLNQATSIGAADWDSFKKGLKSATTALESFGNVGSVVGNSIESIDAQISSTAATIRNQQSIIERAEAKIDRYKWTDPYLTAKAGNEIKIANQAIEQLTSSIVSAEKERSEILMGTLSESLDFNRFSLDKLRNIIPSEFNMDAYNNVLDEINNLALKVKTGSANIEDTKRLEELTTVGGVWQIGKDYADAIKLINDAIEKSTDNIKSWNDSFKTQEQLAAELMNAFGYDGLAGSIDELKQRAESLKGGIDGLTDAELEALNANKDYLESIGEVTNSIEEMNSIMMTSANNVRSLISSLDTPLNNVSYDARQLGVNPAGSVSELADMFDKLRNDADGLTSAELSLINANKALLADTSAYESQISNLNSTLSTVTKNISTLDGALGTIRNTIDSLREASKPAESSLEEFYSSMSSTLAMRGTSDYANFSDAISKTAEKASILLSSEAFTSQRDMNFAQLVAATQFQALESSTMTQIDYLAKIEENTRMQVDSLTAAMNSLGANINASFLSQIQQAETDRATKYLTTTQRTDEQGNIMSRWLSGDIANADMKAKWEAGMVTMEEFARWNYEQNLLAGRNVSYGFASGGYTGDIGISNIAGVVHGGEYVVNAPTTRDLGLNNNNGGVFRDLLGETMKTNSYLSGIITEQKEQIRILRESRDIQDIHLQKTTLIEEAS